LAEKIKKIAVQDSRIRGEIRDIVVSGETQNLSIYFVFEKHVTVLSPLQPIKNNVVLKELFPEADFGHEIILTFSLTRELEERLALPKVILINPYISEKYPVPRLPLNVAIIAAYLRKHQKAQVWILDTQLGTSLDQIEAEILRVKPDVIGVSVPHGQTSLAVSILDRIYSLLNWKRIKSIVVAGNFIAASMPWYFLKRYPGLIIARNEGENTMLDLIDYVQGRRKLSEVSGIFAHHKKQLLITKPSPVKMDDLPLPAMDNIDELSKLKGALTHEWNRGCFWKCSFCPRTHKPCQFKGMSPATVISQLKYFNKVIDRFGLSNHLYLADEETIGGIEDNETERLVFIAKGIIKNKISVKFDAYTRVDQVFNPKMSALWHARRMYMWHLLKRAGLTRLFVGIESGSISQLKRYGKGITPEQSIMALRMLTSLGIEIRLGFIMFDPLMNFQELSENIEFLERRDALVKPLGHLDIRKHGYLGLFERLHNNEFIKKVQLGEPVYTRVSYMLAQLEVLIGSTYIHLLRSIERKTKKKLVSDRIDLSIGKIQVKYFDKEIELLAQYSQQWIDDNFGVMYTIKGLRKTAKPKEEKKLFAWMRIHREISLEFLKAMIMLMKKEGDLANVGVLDDGPQARDLKSLTQHQERLNKRYLFDECLRIFKSSMEKKVINEVEDSLRKGKIADTHDSRLKKAIETWRKSNANLQHHSGVIA